MPSQWGGHDQIWATDTNTYCRSVSVSMSDQKRKADVDNGSLLELIREWCRQNINVELKHKKWETMDWMGLIIDKGSFDINVGFLLGKEFDEVDDLTQKIDGIFQHIIDNSATNTTKKTVPPELLKKAFNKAYEGDSLEKFKNHVNSCYAKWTTPRKSWHSPYTAIVQSSGYGKSRLCKQFACTQTEWLTVYICFRKDEATGYPKANRVARNFLSEMAMNDNGITNVTSFVTIVNQWVDAWRWIRIAFHYTFTQNESENVDDNLWSRLVQNMADFESLSKNLISHSVVNSNDYEVKERTAFWTLRSR
jgi:hypothetical protein